MTLITRTVLFAIIAIVIVYLIYLRFFSKEASILLRLKDARAQSTVPPSLITAGASSDYTFSIWFYINDWNYRIGQEKIIFDRRSTSDKKPAPSVSLGANTNDLTVAIETYSQSGATETSNCVISDVPLQRWTNLIMSVNGRALDLYIDGKLVRTCVLAGPPKTYPNAPIHVCPNGGFSGFVSNFEYIPKSINPSKAYNIYKEGFGGSTLSGLLNKYRLKLSFMKGNKEVNSFEV